LASIKDEFTEVEVKGIPSTTKKPATPRSSHFTRVLTVAAVDPDSTLWSQSGVMNSVESTFRKSPAQGPARLSVDGGCEFYSVPIFESNEPGYRLVGGARRYLR
jgi:hypothetical protein